MGVVRDGRSCLFGWGQASTTRWKERAGLIYGGSRLNDFDLICREFRGGHDITIIPIADVHLGAKECREDTFRRFVQSVKDTPNVFVILGGDLINNSTRSSIGSPFNEVPPHIQKREMTKILEPIADRILCAVSGNHERRSKKDADDDATYDILCKIDREAVYREDIAFLKLQLGEQNTSGGSRSNAELRPTYSIVVTHGSGGGYLPGAAVNRGQRYGYIFDGMDLLVLAHTHVPNISKYRKIKIDTRNNKITTDDFKVVISTSWLEYSGYPVQKMLYPASFAEQSIILSGRGKRITVQTT